VLVFLLYPMSWKFSHRIFRHFTMVSTTFAEHWQMAYQCGRRQLDAHLYSSLGKHSLLCECGDITCLAPHNVVIPYEHTGCWKVWNQSDSPFVVDEPVPVAVGPPL